MITTFNEKEYTKRVRNAFIKALNSDALKYSTFKNGDHKRRATQRAHNYVPGACLCENIDALACVATINGYRDIEENGRKKRVGILKVGKNELLIDFSTFTESQHPFTGVFGDNAYKSVNTDVYVHNEIHNSARSLLEVFDDDEMIGKKCVLRYTIPVFNEHGEKNDAIFLNALWSEESEENVNEKDDMDYPMFHDTSLDEPLYIEEAEGDTDADNESEKQDLPEELEEDGDYESEDYIKDGCDYTISDDDYDGISIRYALMRSQLMVMEFILKYPMAAAAIPCDIFTPDGTYIGQEYGPRQAEIVAKVFKDYKDYFMNRLHELKDRQRNNGYMIPSEYSMLEF